MEQFNVYKLHVCMIMCVFKKQGLFDFFHLKFNSAKRLLSDKNPSI